MFRFILSHPRPLAFGLLLTLFSSFGQTFLISLFVPSFLENFGLSTGTFGTLYAVATLMSAMSLPYFGRLLDRVPLRRFVLAVGAGMAAACFLLAGSRNVAVLFLALLGLRLTGQGLFSLTASTAMARAFDRDRGKALSVSSVGFALGEGVLPVLTVAAISAWGWRPSWGWMGALVLIFFVPLAWWLLHSLRGSFDHGSAPAAGLAARPALFRDPVFYLLLPGNLFVPMVLTALFLYQIPLAESRGWSMATMASAFAGFAISRMIMSIGIGSLIDRWSALRVFPFILLPVAVGLAALLLHRDPWVAWLYLGMAGFSQGMSGPVMTALMAEIYGVETLGSTKGTVTTFAVLSTALGPVCLGALLEMNVSFDRVILGCLVAALMCAVVSQLAASYVERRREGGLL